ncbi:hypothetical protein [Priestia koreensis]|uniref:hypothetical protein n=1 Tax=Priestia koreensis TaxID=284581 RepID=UPI001F57E37F|nr:hypothetical protein [Priestia koreensis]UNL87529.1 hypothetical protein IE339_23780 [Priestia koreensis]
MKRILQYITLSSLMVLVVMFSSQTHVFASSDIPNFVPKQGDMKIEAKRIDSGTSFMSDTLNGLLPKVMDVGIKVITIMFVAAVIVMAFALLMKNGQWTKIGTGVMMGSFVAIIMLRVVPIFMLTSDRMNITLFVNDTLDLLKHISFVAAIGMVIIGLFIRFLHQLLNHPDYFRWSKRLYIGALILTILSTFIPILFTAA